MKPFLLVIIISFCSLFLRAQVTDSLLRIWNNAEYPDSIRLAALHNAAWKMAFNNSDSSIVLAKIELEFTEKTGDLSGSISALNTMGVAATIKGDYIASLGYYNDAIALANSFLEDENVQNVFLAKKGLAQTFINQGILYKNQGDYASALNNQLKALALWEELGSKDKMATAYGNIGVIYKYLGEYKKAREYQMKSIHLRNEIGDEKGQSNAYSNIGTLFNLEGELDSAMVYYLKGLKIDSLQNNQSGISSSYGNIGNLYSDMKQYDKAIEFQKKSLAIDAKRNYIKGMASSNVNLGDYYLELKQYDKAIAYLNRGVALAASINSLKEQKYGRKWMYQAYEAKGNSTEALFNYKKFISIRDSLLNEKTNRDIARTEITFQFEHENLRDSLKREEEKRLQQIEQEKKDALKDAELVQEQQNFLFTAIGSGLLAVLLIIVIIQVIKQKKNNQILSLQKLKIEKSDREKEILIREIHHRVKNNLQIISSLLKGEQRKSDNEAVKSALSYSRQRIESISFIHEKLYQQDDLTNVDLEDYLIDISENLLFSYGKSDKIALNIQSNLNNINADIAVNIGFLTAELITNSIKHGYSELDNDFSLKIQLIKKNDVISYRYSDNGKTAVSFEKIKEKDSFGNKLIHSLIKKLNGKLVEEKEETSGFRLFFNFKLETDEQGEDINR